MRSCVAALTLALLVAAAGCGGSSSKPVSVGELRRALAREGLTTFVVFDRRRSVQHSYSVGVPSLMRNFPWKRFVPAVALISDEHERPNPHGSLGGAVQFEAYLFGTSSAAESAARSFRACLAARNVVVVARPRARGRVEAALSRLQP